jgi:hypothetical protein
LLAAPVGDFTVLDIVRSGWVKEKAHPLQKEETKTNVVSRKKYPKITMFWLKEARYMMLGWECYCAFATRENDGTGVLLCIGSRRPSKFFSVNTPVPNEATYTSHP